MTLSGIRSLDDVLGEIPEGTRTLFSMDAGVDGQLFLINALMTALEGGRRCLVVIPHTTWEIYRCDMPALASFARSDGKQTLFTLDATHRNEIEGKLDYSVERAWSEWRSLMESTCRSRNIDIVFVYFNLFEDMFGFERAILLFKCDDQCPTLIMEYLNLDRREHVQELAEGGYFDLVVSINSGSGTVSFFNFFTLEHVSWKEMPRQSFPYLITDGKVAQYIPKIVVTGPPLSGKSTFVETASEHGSPEESRQFNGAPTTVMLDLGQISCKGFDIRISGTPGYKRFDPIIPTLADHAMGVVLVIDVTRPVQLMRARDLMEKAFPQNLPIVVAANKCDLPHLMSEEYIRSELGLKGDVPIFFISAWNKGDVLHVVEALVDSIMHWSYY